MPWSRSALVIGLVVLAPVVLAPGRATAGVPECGNIRIDPGAECVVEQGECGTTCRVQRFAQACSTEEYQRCQGSCTQPPAPGCTEECAASCDERCAAGVEIVCHDNCFPECTDACTAACDASADTIQCRASCEATCDGECDHQCAMLPDDADCITHCIECCGGSCSAAANMGCQLQCQGQSWAECEDAQQLTCEAACEGEGALFCDGQLVASGAEVSACAAALVDQGVALHEGPGQVQAFDPFGCACRSHAEGAAWSRAALGLVVLLGLRRRRRG